MARYKKTNKNNTNNIVEENKEIKKEEKVSTKKYLIFVKQGTYTLYNKNDKAFVFQGKDVVRYTITEEQVRGFLNNKKNHNVIQSNCIMFIDLNLTKPLND